jgi:hypothetical protein
MSNRILSISNPIVQGIVTVENGTFPVAGVTIVAMMPLGPRAASTCQDELQLGRAVTDSDGAFVLEVEDQDPEVARWACAIRNCAEFEFQVVCLDEGTQLHRSGLLSYAEGMSLEITLREPERAPAHEDWEELGQRLTDSQTVRLDDIAAELATLAPRGLFRTWSVERRLSVLGRLEQALLDPSNQFEQANVQLRFAQLADEAKVVQLRERLRDVPELLRTLDVVLERTGQIGGWSELHPPAHVDSFKRGDYLEGVNHYIDQPGQFPDIIGGFESPTIGYRDYLRDGWADNQRFEHVLGQTNDVEVASRATMIQRLNNRFHQDFESSDTSEVPANRICIGIMLKMLAAPSGSGYGFGIAPAAILPQDTLSDRDYLDYLISLTGEDLEELEKRYRVNLRRSDLALSSPVQQNIDTLQRFFTDSHQSILDPFVIKPDRKPQTAEPLISVFPIEGAGPFFLEYEEWLAREEPFYPENHYDPRATYWWNVEQAVREAAFAKTVPLAQFLNSPKPHVPGGSNHELMKWQWVRNHLELQDIIYGAHNDARSLNYVAAEQKYAHARALAGELRAFLEEDWDYLTKTFVNWDYRPATIATRQKKADVSTMHKLRQYEASYHLYIGLHRLPGGTTHDVLTDGTGKFTDISAKWWGDRPDLFPEPGYRSTVAYLIDHLFYRLLPACLSEMQLAQGKYAEAVWQLVGREGIFQQTPRWLPGPAGFHVFTAAVEDKAFDGLGGRYWRRKDGPLPLPYASWSDRTEPPPPEPTSSLPTNRAELGYYKLKLGNAALEWADVLYRSNQPENIMRARELYKAVLFLHGEDPEITPTWDRRGPIMPPFPWKKSKRNPAIVSQVNRGRLGLVQFDAGLNYYGLSPAHVPPVRYRALKEAADRFAAGARGAQSDFLSYMQQLDQATVAEMQARTMIAKANAAIGIAQEQQKIAEFHVGEVQKQVDAINAQIAAKKAEIAKADSFFEQFKSFMGGMKDSVGKLGELAFAGESEAEAATAQNLSTGDILKLGYKVGSATGVLNGATQALGGAAGVAGPFGAFLYAGVTSMQSMADAIAKRAGELKHLETVALPAAKALLQLKNRDVTIAQLSQAIAKADWQLGNDLLAHFATRLHNRAFLVSMAEFSNRLMRRYLDLAGRTAWTAERALAFEQDRDLGIIAFDYFPRNLRGVSGADLLQLHLAELEAARIQGLTQTIPVKQTVSLAREFPVEFGQLKKTGFCRFATSEAPLRLVHPGVYGYRVRNVTVAAAYTDAIQPHRGLFSNQGVSVVSREKPGSAHMLVRYPDALPLSEFRMRNDMWVFDLPDETLLPFEGSGIETVWELMLSKVGNPNGFESLTDVFITFDMRASYSAHLAQQHSSAMPTSATRAILLSAKAANPGVLAKFREDGGAVKLSFDLAKLAKNPNEKNRKTLNFALAAVGVDDDPFVATFASDNPGQDEEITFEKALALSNAGALANGGVALPLNTFVGVDLDQAFEIEIDADDNPAVDLTRLADVLMLVEYSTDF